MEIKPIKIYWGCPKKESIERKSQVLPLSILDLFLGTIVTWHPNNCNISSTEPIWCQQPTRDEWSTHAGILCHTTYKCPSPVLAEITFSKLVSNLTELLTFLALKTITVLSLPWPIDFFVWLILQINYIFIATLGLFLCPDRYSSWFFSRSCYFHDN